MVGATNEPRDLIYQQNYDKNVIFNLRYNFNRNKACKISTENKFTGKHFIEGAKVCATHAHAYHIYN